jgi:phenylacetic acid degradation protein paaN
MLTIKHQNTIDNAVKANHERAFYSQYPEHPKAYGENAMEQGAEKYQDMLQQPYKQLLQTNETSWAGEELSPYSMQPLGITYPIFDANTLVEKAAAAAPQWRNTIVSVRADILVETLEAIKDRFFEIAYATMHTTGQSFMMSFQASGPHANDRALEAIAMGYHEGTRYPATLLWEKPMGKTSLVLKKEFRAIPKGTGVVIGCSTFPVWNSLPGIFADLVTGNPVIVKPHPKAILPIAIAVSAIQQVLQEKGFSPNLCQLAADTSAAPISKTLCEHPGIQLIDYTGGSQFGNYVESLTGKTVFTEKAGVNSVIIDRVTDIDAVLQNLAFSVSLYSGQMCTAPQNFFIPQTGVTTASGHLSFDEVVQKFKDAILSLVNNPKMGAGTLGALQNDTTLQRAHNANKLGAKVILEGQPIASEEFTQLRGYTPTLLEVNSTDKNIFEQELFGPVLLLIKTRDTNESIQLARQMAQQHGAITCAAYATSPEVKERITEAMNSVFTPVSFNFTGFIWVNQHAAFSDFHVTGGNPAGNASFTNPEFILRRFVWVGNREVTGS